MNRLLNEAIRAAFANQDMATSICTELYQVGMTLQQTPPF